MKVVHGVSQPGLPKRAGWDVHHEGSLLQHKLIQEMDTAVASLISDSEQKNSWIKL